MASTKVRKFNGAVPPEGDLITMKGGKPTVPSRPIIPFIEGDGIGPEISLATRKVVDAAVRDAYGTERQIMWFEIFAGGKAIAQFGELLPKDTLAAIQHFGVAIKGPLATPTGGGHRSANVAMRQALDLYRCVRPVRYFKGVPSVVVAPEKLNVVIFRENTEDVYAGIEFAHNSPEAARLRRTLARMGVKTRADAGLGIKIMSEFGSKRLVRSAIQFAIEKGRKVVTIVHKGNIMKHTEGAFCLWGYEVAKNEFRQQIVTEEELYGIHGGKMPEGKILVNDRIADAMFFEILTRPQKYDVIATPNLNGDFLSDAAATQVGGLGIAPGSNIGDNCALFEATHGTAGDIAGKNLANPCSLLLSAVMMLDYLGWTEAATNIVSAIETTIGNKTVTGDLAAITVGATKLSTSEFGEALITNLPSAVAARVKAKAAEDAEEAERRRRKRKRESRRRGDY